MSVKIEDPRHISPELNILKRLNSFSRPVVDLTESHSETDPQTVTPVHATTVRLSQPPFLQRPETEPSSLGFSLPPLTGRAQTLSQDGHKTTVASNRPPIDSSQVESSQVIESQVSGWLEGNWELAGGILFAHLSQGLKVSPHQGSSKNRSLLRTSSPSAAGDRSASNGFCSPEQLQTEQADSASLRITGQPKRTPRSGHARPDANSEWQLEKVLADDSSNLSDPSRCDAAVQPQLSASDNKDTDQGSSTHGSSTHGSDVDLEEPSYFFWQDASYDEQNGEESRFESEPRSASPDDTAFVCPAALSKLMSGQAQSLLREVSGFIPLYIFSPGYVNLKKYFFLVFLPPCFSRCIGRMKTRQLQLCSPNRAWVWFISLLMRTAQREHWSSYLTCYSPVSTRQQISAPTWCVASCSTHTAPIICVCRLLSC